MSDVTDAVRDELVTLINNRSSIGRADPVDTIHAGDSAFDLHDQASGRLVRVYLREQGGLPASTGPGDES